MSTREYQSSYKKRYNEKNKIVTFPLSNAFYNELNRRAVITDIKTNSFAKHIIVEYLNGNSFKPMSKERHDLISEYIRVSRGIATNINQIAYKTNIDGRVDIDILINSLKIYEEEFKKFIQNTNI